MVVASLVQSEYQLSVVRSCHVKSWNKVLYCHMTVDIKLSHASASVKHVYLQYC